VWASMLSAFRVVETGGAYIFNVGGYGCQERDGGRRSQANSPRAGKPAKDD
jgi:hypothetical protein